MKTDLFQSCGHCWAFQIRCHIQCTTLTASSFRIWNSSTAISSPPLTFFVVVLPKAHLTSHSRMSGSRWMITPSWLPGSLWGNKKLQGFTMDFLLPIQFFLQAQNTPVLRFYKTSPYSDNQSCFILYVDVVDCCWLLISSWCWFLDWCYMLISWCFPSVHSLLLPS